MVRFPGPGQRLRPVNLRSVHRGDHEGRADSDRRQPLGRSRQFSPYSQKTNEQLYKGDYQMTAKQRLTLSYFHETGDFIVNPSGNNVNGWVVHDYTFAQHEANVAHTWTITNNTVNQLMLNYTRLIGGRVPSPSRKPRELRLGLRRADSERHRSAASRRRRVARVRSSQSAAGSRPATPSPVRSQAPTSMRSAMLSAPLTVITRCTTAARRTARTMPSRRR